MSQQRDEVCAPRGIAACKVFVRVCFRHTVCVKRALTQQRDEVCAPRGVPACECKCVCRWVCLRVYEAGAGAAARSYMTSKVQQGAEYLSKHLWRRRVPCPE